MDRQGQRLHVVTLEKLQRLQSQRDGQISLGHLALVMALFVLPYLADVPYLDDHTSTHDIEETFKIDGTAELKHDQTIPILVDDQNDCVGEYGLSPQEVEKRTSSPPGQISPFQRIFHVSLISRPPPIA